MSHEVLNSLKDSQEGFVFSDVSLSVEKYIEKIEEYKSNGNELTQEQQKIFKEAMGIKESLINYRNAINVNEEVTKEREMQNKNSVFYGIFKGKSRREATRSLPEADLSGSDGIIVDSDPFGLELDSMVVKEPTEDEKINVKEDDTKTKDNEVIVK